MGSVKKPVYETDAMVHAPAVESVEVEDDAIDLYALLIRLIEKWYMIAAFALVGAIIAAVVSFCFITPKYQATAKIYVTNNKDSAVNLSDLQISTYLTNDYREVFEVWEVQEMVMQRMNLDYTYEEMAKMISVENPSNTRILKITITSVDPLEAQTMANAYAEVSREYIATVMDTAMPTILEEALLPTKPSTPNKTRNTLLGFILGAIVAIAIVVIRFLSDDYIRTADDIERWVHLPVLGTVMMQKGPEFSAKGSDGKARNRKS